MNSVYIQMYSTNEFLQNYFYFEGTFLENGMDCENINRFIPIQEQNDETENNQPFLREVQEDFMNRPAEVPDDKLNDNIQKDLELKALKDNNINNIQIDLQKATTKMTSKKLLTNKTNRTKITNSDKKQGRKAKDDEEKGEHDKFDQDNMMRKIKSNFFRYIHDFINENICNKDNKLLRLDSHLNEKLKRDFNLKLMDKTFKNLYENTKISKKYKTKDSDENKKLINRIYYEESDKEYKAISLLDKTYRELYRYFIENNLNEFLEKVRNEEEKNLKESEENNIDVYIENLRKLCLSYEDWFYNKRGRNKRSKI